MLLCKSLGGGVPLRHWSPYTALDYEKLDFATGHSIWIRSATGILMWVVCRLILSTDPCSILNQHSINILHWHLDWYLSTTSGLILCPHYIDPWSTCWLTLDQHSINSWLKVGWLFIVSWSTLSGVSAKNNQLLTNCQVRCQSSIKGKIDRVLIEMLIK